MSVIVDSVHTASHKSLRGETLDDLFRGLDRYDIDPLTLPVEVAGMPQWDTMPDNERGRILGGMLRHAVRRAKTAPLYNEHLLWKSVSPDDITNVQDLASLPLISKDSVPGTGKPDYEGIRGFRARVILDPAILIPSGIDKLLSIQERANENSFRLLHGAYAGKELLYFGSGGSLGASTKTHLSYLTVEMEAHALARCLSLNGFNEGMSVACFYSPEHKGGLQLARAADIMRMPFHSKEMIFSWIERQATYKKSIKEFRD